MISVVIATYNREQSLLRTLASFQKQTLSEFEIVIVDNAADPDVEQAVEKFNETARIKVRYVPHRSGGISGARNRGARESSGDILVSTDDDLTFNPGWLTAYEEKFIQYPQMAAAGGCVKPVWEMPPPDWLIEYIKDKETFPVLALMDMGDDFSISNNNIFFGCNMAIRRDVFFKHGGFLPDLYGAKSVGSGDWGIVLRLQEVGEMIGYLPNAIVYHHIPPHRMTVEYIRKWAWHAGAAEMYERWLRRRRTPFALAHETERLILTYWKLWIKAWGVSDRKDPEAINAKFKSSLGRCKLNYVWRMIADTKVKKALKLTGSRL